MKKLLILSLFLSGCGTTKYAVTPAAQSYIAYGGKELVALDTKGNFIWRAAPEQVVALLVKIQNQTAAELNKCLTPAKPDIKKAAAPAKAAK